MMVVPDRTETRPMMLTELASILRRAGLKVVEQPGWKTRGHGQMNAVKTIIVHHTANGGAAGNTPSLNTVINGRPGLKGPLSQLFLAVDGTWYVVAAGLSWHAGVSRDASYGNLWAIGIEAEAEGVPGAKGDWPEHQMASYARGVAALAEHYDVPIKRVLGHKETCAPVGRKSDPSFNMDAFRVRVIAVDLSQKANQMADKIDLDSDQWADHKFTDSDVAALGSPDLKGKSGSWSSLLRFPPAVARLRREQAEHASRIRTDIANTRAEVGVLRAEVGQLRALVDRLVAALPPSPE